MIIRSYSEEDMLHNINAAKHLLLSELARKGHITAEVAELLGREWLIISKKPSLISRTWNKLVGKSSDFEQLMIVQVLCMSHGTDETTVERIKE